MRRFFLLLVSVSFFMSLSCEDNKSATGILDVTINLSSITSSNPSYTTFVLELEGEEIYADSLFHGDTIYNAKIENIDYGTYNCRLVLLGKTGKIKYESFHDAVIHTPGLNSCTFDDFDVKSQTVGIMIPDTIMYSRPAPITLVLSHPELPVKLELYKSGTLLKTFDIDPDSIFEPSTEDFQKYFPDSPPNYFFKVHITDLMTTVGTDLDFIGKYFRFKIVSASDANIFTNSDYFSMVPFYLNSGEDDSEDWHKSYSQMESVDKYFNFNGAQIEFIIPDTSYQGYGIFRSLNINGNLFADDKFELVMAVDLIQTGCVDSMPYGIKGSLGAILTNGGGLWGIGTGQDSLGVNIVPVWSSQLNVWFRGSKPIDTSQKHRVTIVSHDRRTMLFYFDDQLVYEKAGIENQFIMNIRLVADNLGCPSAFDNFAVYGYTEGLEL